jgi:hypothetical protein
MSKVALLLQVAPAVVLHGAFNEIFQPLLQTMMQPVTLSESNTNGSSYRREGFLK